MEVLAIGRETTECVLNDGLARADVVFHLAGINRPLDPSEFVAGNAGLTESLCKRLNSLGRKPTVVLTSSIQADADNPYGRSKLAAEKLVAAWAGRSGARVVIFRLKNVFGKWCRPNYNSVTATFCYNIARNLPISINNEERVLELIYIDDVVSALLGVVGQVSDGVVGVERCNIEKSYHVTLGDLARTIQSFRDARRSLSLPSFDSEFVRRLYATYLSYLDSSDFTYTLEQKTDHRGSLAEFMKSAQFGQIFVSRTKPGITRGNHYHHSKTEKFLVVEGDAVVRFRNIDGTDVIEHRVSGTQYCVVDIPAGYTHSIENVGLGELVTLFWASEVFDPAMPDTYFAPVVL